MSYSHCWRRDLELDYVNFTKAAEDIKKIIARVEAQGIPLAGPLGKGEPELTDFCIAFNGKQECHHEYADLGSPFPSPTARGVNAVLDAVRGSWYSGALLQTRVCGGNCSGGDMGKFVMDQTFLKRSWDEEKHGRYFSYCQTNYKPYDVAVTASLIRLKEHLGDQIYISSDGHERGFEDGKRLCRELFGFAENFSIEPDASDLV